MKVIDIEKYKLTDAYIELEEELNIQILKGKLTKEQTDKVVLFAANEYFRYVDNEKNAWNIIKECLQQIPVVLSVIDIVKFEQSMQKHFYVVFEKNREEIIEIFQKFKVTFSCFDIVIKNETQICFVLLEEFKDDKPERANSVGYKIFNEIERHMISLDYFYYSWDKTKENYMFFNSYDNNININVSFNIFGMRGKREESESRNSQSGYRKDLDYAFRSSWEANIARIFNYNNIKWQYEVRDFFFEIEGKRVEGLKGHYLPDFFLDDNTIIEVKGFWESLSRDRSKLFAQQYKKYKYYIIDNDMYFSLKNKYQDVIQEWEQDGIKFGGSETIQVVGLNFGSRKQTVKTLTVGDKVIFKRDPKNVYDSNALLVFTEDNKEIGFVSSDWAVIYSPKIDMGMTFDAEITLIEPKVISIKVKRNNFDEEIIFDFFK